MRIATRGSELALWQARHIARLLVATGAVSDEADIEIVVVSTSGDRDTTTPLHAIGGKGVFVKEVQAAVLDGRADLAVHSAKDLPAVTPDGLVLAAVPERGESCDALVGARLRDLPSGAAVATGSVRRRAQLAAIRPDLAFHELRGNIATRLAKADGFDAIVVAAVALERLGIVPEVIDLIDQSMMVPQVGQGALAVEHRSDDLACRQAVGAIDHGPSRRVFECERAFLRELGGDCSLPAGAHAVLGADGGLAVTGFLATEDLARHVQLTLHGDEADPLGASLAGELQQQLDR